MDDYLKVYDAFARLTYNHDYKVVIVSGGAKKGGDRFAQKIADDCDFEIIVHEPDFDQYGIPLAYFMRNDIVAQESDILIACLDKDSETSGTLYTIDKFKKFHPKNKLIIV